MGTPGTTTDRQLGRTIGVVLGLVVVGLGILALLAAVRSETERSTAVATSTSNGRENTNIRTDPGAGESIDATTSNGDITVGYSD